MLKIINSGCNGKMGQVVQAMCAADPEVTIVAGFGTHQTALEYPVFTNPTNFTGDADVVIDFSSPKALDGLLSFCLERKLPVVIATTGFSPEQLAQIEDASKVIPVFRSANMSLGINLLIDLACKAAKLLEGSFDIEIVEKHHNKKLDAPSGTALAIADAISDTVDFNAEYVYDRHSVRKRRDKSEIGIHAIRGGTIVGEHDVIFAGTDEVIEIKHSAASKEVFAAGAVKAAIFMNGKPAGMYSMTDLIAEY